MREREVKAVLFDMDGTLVDSYNTWFHVYNDSLEYFNFKILSENEFKKCFGTPIERAIKVHFIGVNTSKLEKTYNHFFKKRVSNVKIFDDAINILEKLKQRKIKLGLVTSSTDKITSTIVHHLKLEKYFGAIITMNDVRRRKPAPDMILKACKILKVSPKNAILVGDTKNDMIAGKRAGCVTVGYKIKGSYRINKLEEIAKLIYV